MLLLGVDEDDDEDEELGDKKPFDAAVRKLVVLRNGFNGRLSRETLPGLSTPAKVDGKKEVFVVC